MLDETRRFPTEPSVRPPARDVYESLRDLPIISPPGHTEDEHDTYFTDRSRVKFDIYRRFGIPAAARDRHLAEFMPLADYLDHHAEWGGHPHAGDLPRVRPAPDAMQEIAADHVARQTALLDAAFSARWGDLFDQRTRWCLAIRGCRRPDVHRDGSGKLPAISPKSCKGRLQ